MESITSMKNLDSATLKELSDKTIHNSCKIQDDSNITIAILIYTLSKLIERADYKKIKNWNGLIAKLESNFSLAIDALSKKKFEAYKKYIEQARKSLESHSVNLKPYIRDVLQKASINKGSKVYEHGISMERTAQILGISQWELSDYIGQKSLQDIKQNQTLDIKKRAKMALEFFNK